jgi:hypothetical protein
MTFRILVSACPPLFLGHSYYFWRVGDTRQIRLLHLAWRASLQLNLRHLFSPDCPLFLIYLTLP